MQLTKPSESATQVKSHELEGHRSSLFKFAMMQLRNEAQAFHLARMKALQRYPAAAALQYRLALRFGANDMGGVMLEENVVRAAGASFYMSREEIVRAIRQAGFTPVQRDTYYRPVRDFKETPCSQ